ncbi:MAG: hypothetical protein R8L07_04220 [Alphaproteobacteria bacterium]|nr:hypothetical protein [Alphaproteobacteria bacterium]
MDTQDFESIIRIGVTAIAVMGFAQIMRKFYWFYLVLFLFPAIASLFIALIVNFYFILIFLEMPAFDLVTEQNINSFLAKEHPKTAAISLCAVSWLFCMVASTPSILLVRKIRKKGRVVRPINFKIEDFFK